MLVSGQLARSVRVSKIPEHRRYSAWLEECYIYCLPFIAPLMKPKRGRRHLCYVFDLELILLEFLQDNTSM